MNGHVFQKALVFFFNVFEKIYTLSVGMLTLLNPLRREEVRQIVQLICARERLRLEHNYVPNLGFRHPNLALVWTWWCCGRLTGDGG